MQTCRTMASMASELNRPSKCPLSFLRTRRGFFSQYSLHSPKHAAAEGANEEGERDGRKGEEGEGRGRRGREAERTGRE